MQCAKIPGNFVSESESFQDGVFRRRMRVRAFVVLKWTFGFAGCAAAMTACGAETCEHEQ